MQRGTRCDGKMAEPPEKKPDASKPTEIRVLPMELKLGGESVKQPGVTDIRSWGAHERITVRRG